MMEIELSPESWRAAVNIVITKPHSVDKRLAGQQTVQTYQYNGQNNSDFLIKKTKIKGSQMFN